MREAILHDSNRGAMAIRRGPWKLSLGPSVDKMVRVDEGEKVEINGQMFTGPLLVARKTTLREISFVALADDDRTSATVAPSAAEQEIEVIA